MDAQALGEAQRVGQAPDEPPLPGPAVEAVPDVPARPTMVDTAAGAPVFTGTEPRAWSPRDLPLAERIQRLEQDPFLAATVELLYRGQENSQIGPAYRFVEDTLRPLLVITTGPDLHPATWHWCERLASLVARLEATWLPTVGVLAVAGPVPVVLAAAEPSRPELEWVGTADSGWLLVNGTPAADRLAPAGARALHHSLAGRSGELPWWLLLGVAEWAREGPGLHRDEATVPLNDLLAIRTEDDLRRRLDDLQSVIDQVTREVAIQRTAGSFVGFCLAGNDGADAHLREALLDWARRLLAGEEDPGDLDLLAVLGVADLDELERAWRGSLPPGSRPPR